MRQDLGVVVYLCNCYYGECVCQSYKDVPEALVVMGYHWLYKPSKSFQNHNYNFVVEFSNSSIVPITIWQCDNNVLYVAAMLDLDPNHIFN